MAIIGKLQSNKVLVVGFIGGALLLFIVSMYLTQSGPSADENKNDEIGLVNGVGIDPSEYSDNVDFQKQNIFFRKLNNAQTDEQKIQIYQQGLTENEEAQAERDGFSLTASNMLLKAECAKLGITVTEEEVQNHMYGTDEIPVHPYVQNNFRDSTGKFSVESLDAFLNQEISEENGDQATKQIERFNELLRLNILSDKYQKIVATGNYVTKLEAKREYVTAESKRNIRLIVKKYADVVKDMEITDEQLKSYYEEHKNEKVYEQKDGVVISYFSVPVQIVDEDREKNSKKLAALTDQLKNAEDDSTFVMQNMGEIGKNLIGVTLSYGENKQFGTYPESFQAQVSNAKVGDVIGPLNMMFNNGEYAFAGKVKSIETKKQAWVRHILIKANENDADFDAKKAFADSLTAVVKNDKSKFVQFVQTYSEDPGSKASNGEYKWFDEGRMVPEFNDFSFNGAIGEVKNVKTTYGFHIVEVLGREDRAHPVVNAIAQKMEPLEASLYAAETKVYDLKDKIFSNPENFDTIVKSEGLNPSTQAIYTEIARVPPALRNVDSKVLNFALNKGTKTNDLSKPISDGNNIFVVMVKKKLAKGTPEFEDVKDRMRFAATKEVAGEKLKAEMKGFKSLEEVASKMGGLEIKTAEVSLKEANIPQVGTEPAVVGALFSGIKKGEITQPIAGRTGVYVVEVVEVKDPAETSDYTTQLEAIKARQNAFQAMQYALQGLIEKFEPVDNRNRKKYGAL